MILIVTIADDLHALAVRESLRSTGFHGCHIIECDRIAQHNFLSYGLNYDEPDRLSTSDGKMVSVSQGTVLWIRTLTSSQRFQQEIEDESALTVIQNDSLGGLVGYLSTHFRGKWISSFEATYAASDKIAQLKVAMDCGFRIPKTLVTQSRQSLEDFFQACDGQVIVKTIVGATGPFLRTVKIDHPRMFDEQSFQAAPNLFQEYIPGRHHLRLNCFGNASYAARIDTSDLDWRPNLNVPITEYPVDDYLHSQVRNVLDKLGLEMGIVDLKITSSGEPVWLEVNPQGQFLFLDAFTTMRLADKFAAYLYEEHLAKSHQYSPLPA